MLIFMLNVGMLKNGPVLFAEKDLESCYRRTIGCQPPADIFR
jgi:hypothetical protein